MLRLLSPAGWPSSLTTKNDINIISSEKAEKDPHSFAIIILLSCVCLSVCVCVHISKGKNYKETSEKQWTI